MTERCSNCGKPTVWIQIDGMHRLTCANSQCTGGHQPAQQELQTQETAA